MLVLVDPAEKGGPEDSVGEVGARHARTFRFNSACKDVLIIFIIFLCLVLTLNKSHSWKKKKIIESLDLLLMFLAQANINSILPCIQSTNAPLKESPLRNSIWFAKA